MGEDGLVGWGGGGWAGVGWRVVACEGEVEAGVEGGEAEKVEGWRGEVEGQGLASICARS